MMSIWEQIESAKQEVEAWPEFVKQCTEIPEELIEALNCVESEESLS